MGTGDAKQLPLGPVKNCYAKGAEMVRGPSRVVLVQVMVNGGSHSVMSESL